MGGIVKVIYGGTEPGKPGTLAHGESRAGEKKGAITGGYCLEDRPSYTLEGGQPVQPTAREAILEK